MADGSAAVRRPYRLAVLASHVIQYQAPLFRVLAARPDLELTVLFCSDWGLKAYRDDGFGQEIRWDVPLLEGYRWEFLSNWSQKPNPSKFWGLINPGVLWRLREGSFDALWIHGWARCTDWLALFTAFASGVPVLLRGEANLLPALPRWKSIAKRAILTHLFRRVAAFLAIGRYNAEFYQAYGVPREKIFPARYAVDNDLFLSRAAELLPRKIELKRTLGIPENLSIILFSGKLTAVKRPMDLLKAYAQVSKKSRAALMFVGDGPLRGDLEASTREQGLRHVYFVGFHNQTELSKFYAVADVFVLPSGFEPWGLVINEAMCFGLPIIASNAVGAAGDLLCSGENGFQYPVGDISQLADRLIELLRCPEKRLQMGRRSLEIISRWNYDLCVEGVLAALSHVSRRRFQPEESGSS